jgi:hypothetical protein
MIAHRFTPEQYALLDMLEDAKLMPVRGEDGKNVDAVDPRMRVLQAQLADVLENFDGDGALLLARLSDELKLRHEARIAYIRKIEGQARAAASASQVMVGLLQHLMIAHDVGKVVADDMTMEIVQTESNKEWRVTDIEKLPERFWLESTERVIDPNSITQHFLISEEPLPGVEWVDIPGKKSLRRV